MARPSALTHCKALVEAAQVRWVQACPKVGTSTAQQTARGSARQRPRATGFSSQSSARVVSAELTRFASSSQSWRHIPFLLLATSASTKSVQVSRLACLRQLDQCQPPCQCARGGRCPCPRGQYPCPRGLQRLCNQQAQRHQLERQDLLQLVFSSFNRIPTSLSTTAGICVT